MWLSVVLAPVCVLMHTFFVWHSRFRHGSCVCGRTCTFYVCGCVGVWVRGKEVIESDDLECRKQGGCRLQRGGRGLAGELSGEANMIYRFFFLQK